MATNFEFYKDMILEFARKHRSFPTVINGKVCECSVENCIRCFFNSPNCFAKKVEWLYAEHIEQPKLTKRERAFCEAAMTGWISRDFSGNLSWRDNKPKKVSEKHDKYWLGNGSTVVWLNTLFEGDGFGCIKWEDEKPWAVEDLLKLEVMEVQEDA